MLSPETQVRERNRAARGMAERSRSIREIGPWPVPMDAVRRKRGLNSLREHLEIYYPKAFYLPWSPDHKKSIDKLDEAIHNGGLFSWAMPRGSGKTAICERAAIYADLCGAQKFTGIIGGTAKAAADILEHIQTELSYNELLRADFPKPCHAFWKLEADSKKTKGQICEGHHTSIIWRKNKLVFPLCPLPDNEASEAIIMVAGITGSIRGMNHTMADGRVIRPGLVICDDPQTRESAMSVLQSQTRESIISGDILGLAGPGKKIAAVMPCTVIRKGDMADRMLNRKSHPSWQGERFKMVYKFPANDRLWEQYSNILSESLINDGDGSEATDFYRDHRAEMDEGSEVAWPELFDQGEISAIQHAMNLRFRDPVAFDAEYQNDPPEMEDMSSGKVATIDQIKSKVSGMARWAAPLWCQHITGYIDVQQDALYWMVCGWGMDGTGQILSYGIHPDPGVSYITLARIKKTLRMVSGSATVEGGIRAGLESVETSLLSRSFKREDGAEMKIGRLLIDSGYWTSTIAEHCRRSKFGSIVMPSKGIGISAAQRPLEQYSKKPGERIGHHWMISFSQKNQVRHFDIDVNWWKTWVHERLSLTVGDSGSLGLFGSKSDHILLYDHLQAESCVKTEGRERTVYQWTIRPGKPDNHFLDCLVGCASGANEQGVRPDPGAVTVRVAPNQRRYRALSEAGT